MKKHLYEIALITTYLFIADYCDAQSERFILNQKLYQKFFPSIEDSSNLLIGINYQLNDFEQYDGNVIQLASRFKIKSDNQLVRSSEFGLNVDGYFNQDFYSPNTAPNKSVYDWAWDGYNISATFWNSISIKKSKLFVSFSPGVNIIKRLVFIYYNGKYLYDHESAVSEEFAGDISLAWRYKAFELFYNYYYNPISQIYVDWSDNLNALSGLYDTSKTYYFRTSTPYIKYSIYYSKYGIIYYSKIKSNQISFYYYTDLWGFSFGTNYKYKGLSINPEYTFYPLYSQDPTGYQSGIMMNYNFINGLSINVAFLFTERVLYYRKIRAEFGIKIKT